MKRKNFFVILSLMVVVSCLNNSTWNVDLPVPYLETATYHSAAHCIAMWSAADGVFASEESIAAFLGGGFSYGDLEWAIEIYTDSVGWVTEFPNTDDGQNKALSAVAEGLTNDCPSIVPMYGGDNFWLAKGGHGHYDGYVPIADYMTFHYLEIEDFSMPVGMIKHEFFSTVNNHFIALVGRRRFEIQGLEDYEEFVTAGGTYWGAPPNYVPDPSLPPI